MLDDDDGSVSPDSPQFLWCLDHCHALQKYRATTTIFISFYINSNTAFQ